MSTLTTLIISACFFITTSNGARILALFPFPAHSHEVVNHLLSTSLAKRGHDLTVFTTNPLNKNIPNYTEHSLNHFYPFLRSNFNYADRARDGIMRQFLYLRTTMKSITDALLSNNHLKEYLSPNSTKKFDLVIISSLSFDALYYIPYLLNVPLITMVTSPGFPLHYFEMGNLLLPGRFPVPSTQYSDQMNFWQRLENLATTIVQWCHYHYILQPMHEGLLAKHFGDNLPSIEDLHRRISMMFLNTHPLLHYSRPMPPNVVAIGGFRMGSMNKTLPQNLKTLLDNANQGFIYFSLGSNINSSNLKREILEIIIAAFSELPYLVVWKFDASALPQQPKNVFIQKWIPQYGVLAHPNIKLFIFQGGIQSSEEAIECGVPLLGMPVIFDQHHNVEALKQKGIAESLNLYTMTKRDMTDTIHRLISNPKYKENARRLSNAFRDLPQHPLDEAVWWSEYVIRNKGAPYMQMTRLPWYKYHMIDIYIFLAGLLLIISYCFWKLISFILGIKTSLHPLFGKGFANPRRQKKLKKP